MVRTVAQDDATHVSFLAGKAVLVDVARILHGGLMPRLLGNDDPRHAVEAAGIFDKHPVHQLPVLHVVSPFGFRDDLVHLPRRFLVLHVITTLPAGADFLCRCPAGHAQQQTNDERFHTLYFRFQIPDCFPQITQIYADLCSRTTPRYSLPAPDFFPLAKVMICRHRPKEVKNKFALKW